MLVPMEKTVCDFLLVINSNFDESCVVWLGCTVCHATIVRT